MKRGRREAYNASAPQSHNRDRDVDRLQRQVNGLERDIQNLTNLVQDGSVQSEIARTTGVRDQPWRCDNCKGLLGWYNTEKDVMRIRYKQQTVFVRIGQNGFIQSICPGCSEPNTLNYEPSGPEADEGAE